jgi:hypothetical protein
LQVLLHLQHRGRVRKNLQQILDIVRTGEEAPVIYAPKAHYKIIKRKYVQGADLQKTFRSSFNDMSFNDLNIIFTDLVGFVRAKE